jgi:hypothetical protein
MGGKVGQVARVTRPGNGMIVSASKDYVKFCFSHCLLQPPPTGGEFFIRDARITRHRSSSLSTG